MNPRQNVNAGYKSSIGCGRADLPARRGRHSRRFLTTSALSVADELLGFFGAGEAVRAGVGFPGVPRIGKCEEKVKEHLSQETRAPVSVTLAL